MKTKKIKMLPFIMVFFIAIGFTANLADAGTWVKITRYLSDDAIVDNECGTWDIYGATANVRHQYLYYLGMYVDTNGFWDAGKSYIKLDGGYYEASPWELPYTRDWEVYVNWIFEGNYNEEGYNYLKFEYELYYVSGLNLVSVLTRTITYSSDFNYDDDTDVSHYLGNTGTLDHTEEYYLSCYIELYQNDWFHSVTSDLMVGSGNKIAFDSVDFQFWMDYY